MAVLAFTASIGVLRISSAGDMENGEMMTITKAALFIVSLLATLTVATMIAVIHVRLDYVNQRLREVEHEMQAQAATLGRLHSELQQAQEVLGNLRTRVGRPDELKAQFEQGMRVLERRRRTDASEAEDRIARAVSAWRELQPLSVPVREAVVNELYELHRSTSEKENGTGSSNGSIVGSLVIMLMLAGGATSTLTACEASPALSVIVICDGTGIVSEDVCNRSLLTTLARDWTDRACTRSRSRFLVVTTAGDFGSTRVAVSLEVPNRFEGDIREARANMIATFTRTAATAVVPRDEGRPPQPNQSDLFSALAVAARQARDLVGHERYLVIASDGWFRSAGMNAEASVPSLDATLSTLDQAGLQFNLSMFSGITMCGLHNAGARPGAVNARDELWRRLLLGAGARGPSFLSSCRGLESALPKMAP